MKVYFSLSLRLTCFGNDLRLFRNVLNAWIEIVDLTDKNIILEFFGTHISIMCVARIVFYRLCYLVKRKK